MDSQKIKKSAANLWNVFLSLILVIGVFTGLFAGLNYFTTESGISLDSNYSHTFSNLQDAQSNMSKTMKDIRDSAQGITEAESGLIVAINGFRGLGNILKLPLNFINIILGVNSGILGLFENIGIPIWITILVELGLTGFIVLLILSILKGEQYKTI